MNITTICRVGALVGLIGLLAAGPLACGGGSSGGTLPVAPSRTYVGTQSPGDLWSWALHPGGTFDATNETLGYDYAGTYVSLPSDFLKLTVASSTDPGVSIPGTAYAFEVPRSALVVKPLGSGANVMVAVSTSTCFSGSTLQLGWVELTRLAWDPTTEEAYGIANVAIAGSTWNLATSAFLLDGTPGGGDVMAGLTCSGGIILDPADPAAVIAMARTGVFMRDAGPGAGGVIGMRLPAASVSLANLTRAGREFRGISFKDHSTVAEDSVPVWARPDGEGGLWGGEYEDIEANVEHARPPAVLEFGAQVTPGIVNGTLTDGAGSSDIVFMINRLGGRYFLFGISVNTHDLQPYNFIAIETGP